MSYNAFVNSRTGEVNTIAVAAGTAGVADGARWFWWISSLSLLSAALAHWGHATPFVTGLGLGLGRLHSSVPLAFTPALSALHAVLLGFFVCMGWFARRGNQWAFIAGGLVYATDGLTFLKSGNVLPIGIHLVALAFIVRGAFALHSALLHAHAAALDQEPKLSAEQLSENPPRPPI